MKIAQKYSHLNGEEYLLVHHKKEYDEIINVIKKVNANKHKTKVSKERGRKGDLLYNPTTLNIDFKKEFDRIGWKERRKGISLYQLITKSLRQLNH